VVFGEQCNKQSDATLRCMMAANLTGQYRFPSTWRAFDDVNTAFEHAALQNGVQSGDTAGEAGEDRIR
jgi:hypothetical protein